MAEEKPKKSVFGKIADAMSNKDEIEAAEAAKKEAEAARKEAARAKAELARMKAAEAREKAEKLEAQKKEAVDKFQKGAKELKEREAAAAASQMGSVVDSVPGMAAAAKQEPIKHVWTREDTYASLAQKFYGSFKEPYWRLIYEHNKDIIGNHPNDIRLGLEIEIPPLPEELKLKK